MDLLLRADALRGTVTPPNSKSLLHRLLIADALAGGTREIDGESDDVRRTQEGVAALLVSENPRIDCGASGSTLRFLMPLAAALGKRAAFTGEARLFQRPLADGLPFERTGYGVCVNGALRPGVYAPESGVSSQFVSGLLFALPLLPGESQLRVGAEAVSRPYIEMTLRVLERYGVVIRRTAEGYAIPGAQRFRRAAEIARVERDFSAAAYWLTAAALGQDVRVTGLTRPSLQGDAAMEELLRALPEEVDLSDTPDLFPPLALFAALREGKETRFTALARLREKESDRLRAVAAALRALGGCAAEGEDTLLVRGVSRLRGGVVESCRDHRIAMLAGVAAAFCETPVRLTGAECVEKSYAGFWDDFRSLGGVTEEV